MGKTLSLDLRERVVGAVEDGTSCRGAAERFGVAASTAIRWVKRWRGRGSLVAGTRGGNRRSHRIDAHRDTILALIEAEPDLTLVEIGERLEATTGYRPARSVVHEFFVRHAITRKKRPATRASRSGKT
ncbi:MAG: IS630 transposase-related protein [Devosia sp.]